MEALLKFREARGTIHKQKAWNALSKVISEAKSSEWRGIKVTKTELSLSSSEEERMRKAIKKRIKPLGKVGSIMQVGGQLLQGQEADEMWARFFEAQTSEEGPRSPEQLLNRNGWGG